MDVAFEFLLPDKTDISDLDLKPRQFHWQGVNYSQEPVEASFGSNFILMLTPPTSHIISELPKKLQKKSWICITVLGKGLDIFRESLLGNAQEEPGRGLKDLTEIILGKNLEWIVAFEPDSDLINEIIEGTLQTVLRNIESSLVVQKKGFVIYSVSS
jgi:hypothetical protein